MLSKSTGCRTTANKTCEIRGGAIFGRKRLDRDSHDDVTNIISRGSRPSGFRQIKLISFERRELEINYFLLAYKSIWR